MNQKALHNISYGLYVITTNADGKDNGCISNTITQLSSDPLTIGVAINKANLTCEMISKSKKFTASIISEDADFELFKHFGFQSGRDVDKFADYSYAARGLNGAMVITKGTNAFISADVIQEIDLGSHILFVGTPTDYEVINDTPSATYAYYFENIKPKPESVGKTADGKTVWRCTICGYEYVGEELPDDFVCPLCKHPASDFEKVVL